MSESTVLYVDDDTLAQVVDVAHGALVLAKDDCDNCAAYEAEIRRLQRGSCWGTWWWSASSCSHTPGAAGSSARIRG